MRMTPTSRTRDFRATRRGPDSLAEVGAVAGFQQVPRLQVSLRDVNEGPEVLGRGRHRFALCSGCFVHPDMIAHAAVRSILARHGNGQEIAAFTSSTTFASTTGLHSLRAYDTGHRSPSSRFAASWKPRVEYL